MSGSYFKRKKKQVKRFARGGLSSLGGTASQRGSVGGLTQYANNEETGDDPQPVGGLEAQVDGGTGKIKSGAPAPDPVTGKIATADSYAAALNKAQTEKEQIIQKAIERMQSRGKDGGVFGTGLTSREGFSLAASLLKPTRTGTFGETLGNFSGAAADVAKGREDELNQIDALGLKKADLTAEGLKQTLEAKKLQAAQSKYGREAIDEGFEPGTPEYNARVTELITLDRNKNNKTGTGKVNEDGSSFDVKSGNFITPSGSVVKGAEVQKDREERVKLVTEYKKLESITDEVIKNSLSPFDVTGGVSRTVAGYISPKLQDAQNQVYNQALEGIMKALPPGPASDKDVENARRTFPGFSNKVALDRWLASLKDMVRTRLDAQDEKYGSDHWYGQKKAPSIYTKDEAPKPGAPQVGQVVGNFRFKGGDPSDQKNYERIK